MTRAVAYKYEIAMCDIVGNNEDMIKALLHRMASCPGIMNKKMRCYSKFKHLFQGIQVLCLYLCCIWVFFDIFTNSAALLTFLTFCSKFIHFKTCTGRMTNLGVI